MTVVEDTSKGDMLLKTGQMAVRVMRDFQVYNELHCSVLFNHHLKLNVAPGHQPT